MVAALPDEEGYMSTPNEIDITDQFLAAAFAKLSPRDRIRILDDAPKTLWLFGAGASHHYDLNSSGVPVPLANGFFEAFNSLPTSRGFDAHVGPFVSYLNHCRGVRPYQPPHGEPWLQHLARLGLIRLSGTAHA